MMRGFMSVFLEGGQGRPVGPPSVAGENLPVRGDTGSGVDELHLGT